MSNSAPHKWENYGSIFVYEGGKSIALVNEEKYTALITAAPELYWMVYNLLFELKHGNGSNPEYVKQAILQMEELLKRIQGTVEKPKPCPFCGGTPYIASDKNNLTAAVKCPLCGATIRVFSKDGDTASAISAWNRREQ